jgi:uncharacterized protein
MRSSPELVVLGVAEGVTPSSKPPVRIYLGTEPAQYRAERIFIWSIECVRDPARVYEIYLMKELAGFDRRRWLTGFTNYRFAIPHFADGSGRAIWNDVDQAYLADPAELFDTEMGDCGVLTVPPLSSTALLDTAVMLIDCERMASVWTGEEAMHGRKNNLLAKARAVPGLRGDLPGEWNARDEEYVPGRSKLLHWTILHTQPWHPLPQLFVYQHNPVGQVWYDMEKAANLAGYQVFTADRPSAQYNNLLAQLQDSVENRFSPDQQSAHPSTTATEPEGLHKLIEKTRPATVLEYCFADNMAAHPESAGPLNGHDSVSVTRYDPADPRGARPDKCFDGVVCTQALNYIPDEDIPWVIEDLFEWARRFVYIVIERSPQEKALADGSCLHSRPRDFTWWKNAFEAAAERHPNVQWKLVFDRSSKPKKSQAPHEIGWGRDASPRVWVLNDGHVGDTSQSVALADALGWPYEIRHVPFTSSEVAPGLVLAANERTGKQARQLCLDSSGHTRCVRIDGTGGVVADHYDVVVSPAYFHLPPHPHRIESTTLLTRVTPERLALARDNWPRLFGQASHPRVAVLISGNHTSVKINSRIARRMGEEIRTLVQLAGGSVFALLDQCITPGLAGALVAGLGESRHVYTWSADRQDDDTYLAYLELADALIVAGDDESLIADAAATGKPVQVYPLPARRPGLTSTIREAVFTRSQSRPLNKRGTVRPQQGLEYFCARLIERGVVLPPHDLTALHQSLIRLGIVQPFGAPFVATTHRTGLRAAHDAARQVRRVLGLGAHAELPESDPHAATDWTQYAATQP